MPWYSESRVDSYYLYFTDKCLVEAFHAHSTGTNSRDRRASAKFFIYNDGSSKVMRRGRLSDREIRKMQDYIRDNYVQMYELWVRYGGKQEFYNKR